MSTVYSGHLSFGFRGQQREVGKLLAALDAAGVAVSVGSACSAHHAGEPSGILLSMGYDPEEARGLIRLSLGRFNTQSEVDRFIEVMTRVVSANRRSVGPIYCFAEEEPAGATFA